MTTVSLALIFLAGAALWTLAEYSLHRWAFHEARGSNYGSKEHLRHHAQRDYVLKSVALSWTGVFVVSFLVLRPLAGLVGGADVGWAFGTGYAAGFFFYEYVHAAAHWRAPRTAYGAWVRRHHFHHHFHAPLKNHGVTSPFWDRVFGTYIPAQHVTIPRRLATVWMLDEHGEVKPEFAGTYKVRGSLTADQAVQQDDWDRAFANQVPA